MKILKPLLFMLLLMTGNLLAQNPSSPKDWTSWSPVTDDWTEFYVFTKFRGGNRTPEQLAKKELKSLKVECVIVGRIKGDIPHEIIGVKAFKILYREYGMIEAVDLGEDTRLVYYRREGQIVPAATIIRPATQFDVDEASKPASEAELTTNVPTFLSMLGVDPIKSKISGRRYRVPLEWRRKGSTVEIRLKHYALNGA